MEIKMESKKLEKISGKQGRHDRWTCAPADEIIPNAGSTLRRGSTAGTNLN